MAKSKKTFGSHLEAVEAALKLRGMSKYMLAKKLEKDMKPNVVYSYLRGEVGISMDKFHAMNAALGIVYTIEE